MKSIRLSKLKKFTQNWKDHSKIFSHLIQKSIKNQPDFSRTCGFRCCFRENLYFCFKPSKIPNQRLDFRQNLLKVEKWLFLARFVIFEWSKNFPGKTGRVTILMLSYFNFIPSFGKILRAVTRETCSHPTLTGIDHFPDSTSTKVENSTPLTDDILKTEDAADMGSSR